MAKITRRVVLGMPPLMAACLTVGCSPDHGEKTNDGKVVVSMFGRAPKSVKDLKTNWFTKFASDKFKIEFQFKTVNTAGAHAKQSVLLNSGDYPDVIFDGQITSIDAQKYGKQGVFIDLKPLLQEKASKAWAEIQSVSGLEDAITTPDGKIYTIPKNSGCFHCEWNRKMWVNIKYLEKFNLSMPRTTDDFEKMLGAFKEAGLVPMTGAVDGSSMDPSTFLMNAFLPTNATLTTTNADPAGFLNVNKGKVQYAATQAAWRDGLAYLGRLYEKGFFNKSALTQELTQVQQLLSQHKVAVVPTGAIFGTLPGAIGKESDDWMPIPALVGPDGVQAASFTGGVEPGVFAITNKASEEVQTAMMKLLDYIWTLEGNQIRHFGPEGKYWKHAESGTVGLTGEPAEFDTDRKFFTSGTAAQNEGWNHFGPENQGLEWKNKQVIGDTFGGKDSEPEQQLFTEVAMAGHQAPQQFPTWVWLEGKDVQRYAELGTNLNNLVAQRSLQFITGERDLHKDWTAFQGEMEKLGAGEYVELAQKGMNKPLDTSGPEFQPDPKNVNFLLCNGKVPAAQKKYLIQSGVTEDAFLCKK